ncbi:hypothetical protein Tco_1541972 [Tanacetum coccineum]
MLLLRSSSLGTSLLAHYTLFQICIMMFDDRLQRYIDIWKSCHPHSLEKDVSLDEDSLQVSSPSRFWIESVTIGVGEGFVKDLGKVLGKGQVVASKGNPLH